MRGVSGGSSTREELGWVTVPLVAAFFRDPLVAIRETSSMRVFVLLSEGSGDGDFRGRSSSCALGDMDSVRSLSNSLP